MRSHAARRRSQAVFSAAWTNAEALRALRRVPRVRDDYLETLGRTVGLVSRALLVPTA